MLDTEAEEEKYRVNDCFDDGRQKCGIDAKYLFDQKYGDDRNANLDDNKQIVAQKRFFVDCFTKNGFAEILFLVFPQLHYSSQIQYFCLF